VRSSNCASGAAVRLTLSGSFTDISQVLQDNGRSWLGLLHDALGEDVIVIFSLPKQLTRKCFQVPCSRFGACSLQLASQAEKAAFLLFPASLTQKELVRGDCRALESQVNPNHLIGAGDHRCRQGHNDMQKVAPLPVAQISTTDLAADVLSCVPGNGQPHFKASHNGGKAR